MKQHNVLIQDPTNLSCLECVHNTMRMATMTGNVHVRVPHSTHVEHFLYGLRLEVLAAVRILLRIVAAQQRLLVARRVTVQLLLVDQELAFAR